MASPADLLAVQFRRDPARPLVTSYDEERGARVELSVATVVNWVAKLGNAMTDEWGLEEGDTVALDLPAHWVGAVAALAVWTVGGVVVDAGTRAAFTVARGPAALTAQGLAVELDPMGMDLSRLVAAYPDALLSSATSAHRLPDDGATTGLPDGGRLLSTLAFDRTANAVTSVVVPLLAGGSAVVVSGAPGPERLAGIATTENVVATAGTDLSGLPRLG